MLEVLRDLSFSEQQLTTIRKFCIEMADVDNSTRETQLKAKRRELGEIIEKLDKLEEKVLSDLIDARTYKKWFPKFSLQKAAIEVQIKNLQTKSSVVIDQIDAALPRLSNLRRLYMKSELDGKQALLNKVFEHGLVYDGKRFRTPYLHPAFTHNYVKIKEKGLLEIEQPLENLANLDACTA